MAERILVALGGNALVRAGQRGTIQEQMANLDRAMAGIVPLIQRGCQVVITNGNCSQVRHIKGVCFRVKNEYDGVSFGDFRLNHQEERLYGQLQKVFSIKSRSKEAGEEKPTFPQNNTNSKENIN